MKIILVKELRGRHYGGFTEAGTVTDNDAESGEGKGCSNTTRHESRASGICIASTPIPS